MTSPNSPPRRPILRLVAVAWLILAVALPALAGTPDDPEITDPAGDSAGQAGPPVNAALGPRDLVKVYIEDTLADLGGPGPGLVFVAEVSEDFDHQTSSFALHDRIRIAYVPSVGLPAGTVEAYVNILPGIGTTANTGAETVGCRAGFAAAAGGSQAIQSELSIVGATFTPKIYKCPLAVSALAGFDLAAGHKITGLYAQFQLVSRGPTNGGDNLPVTIHNTYDRAPNTGVGRDWPASAVGGGGSLNDTDSDGLNDTWETTHFSNTTAQNATGDPDADNQTNQQEFFAGTDPMDSDSDDDGLNDGAEAVAGTNPLVADTDGDGANDGAEVAAGTDPLDPASTPPGTSGTATSTGSGTSTRSNTATGSRTATNTDGAGGSGNGGGPANLDEAIELIKDDVGYLVASAAGFASVLFLSILALAARWSL